MKIFLDSAITTDIQDRLPTEIIDGVTTNPTLIRRVEKTLMWSIRTV